MNITTIPKKSTKQDVVTIPRKDYEALLGLKKFREFSPTAAQKKALVAAERRLQKGKTLSYHECVKELGFAN